MISAVLKYDETGMYSTGRCSGVAKELPLGKKYLHKVYNNIIYQEHEETKLMCFHFQKLKYKIHYFNFTAKETPRQF